MEGLITLSKSGYFDLGLGVSTTGATRVLHVEDKADDDLLFKATLGGNGASGLFCLNNVPRLADAFDFMTHSDVDIVLLDLNLPDSCGIETFEKLHAEFPSVPVIILSGHETEMIATIAVKKGAQDYLVKDEINQKALIRSIRYAIERNHAARQAAYERRLLSMMMENIPDRIYFKDEHSRFVSASRSLAEFYNIPDSKALIGKSDFDSFTNDYAQPAFDDEQEIIRTGKPMIGKIERETLLDGRVCWALTTKMPLREDGGKIVGTFGITKDITELFEIKQTLDEERNLLRRLIDSLPDHIYVKDLECRFKLCNEAVAAFFGLTSPNEIFGKKDSDFFSRELAATFLEEDHLILKKGQCVNREYESRDKTGDTRFMMTTKVPLRDAHGAIVGLVGINRDVTALKTFNDRLRAANENLEKALTDVKKSREELEEAHAQILDGEKLKLTGRMAAGIAHEVKNPLAIISMGMECLSQSIPMDDPAVTEIIKDINDAIQRANLVIGDLLDFSKPRSLALKPNDLNTIIEQSLLFVRHELNIKHIHMVKRLSVQLPALNLDAGRIKQVFVNLFMNAIHAMPDKGQLTVSTFVMPAAEFVERNCKPSRDSIRFSTAKKTGTPAIITKSESGESVRITQAFKNSGLAVVARVEDNGTGIPEQNLTSIFEPFFTTKLSGKGHGLGLPVTKQIVDLHGGLIELKNGSYVGVCATVAFLAEGDEKGGSV